MSERADDPETAASSLPASGRVIGTMYLARRFAGAHLLLVEPAHVLQNVHLPSDNETHTGEIQRLCCLEINSFPQERPVFIVTFFAGGSAITLNW